MEPKNETSQILLSVSVVVYKTPPELLERAVRGVLLSSLPTAIMVVDNSPTDDLRKTAERIGLEYHFVGRNSGYGSGHNIAIKRFTNCSRFHLVLNPDIDLDPEVLRALCDFMSRNTDVGAVMPRILYPDGRDQKLCRRLPTPLDLFVRRFLPRFVKQKLQRRLDKYECGDLTLDQPRVVPHLSGSFMFVCTDVLDALGGFDERFFLYLEDTDLSRRIRTKYLTVYFPGVSIYHDHAQGSYKNPKLMLMHVLSAIKYFNKWGWFFDPVRSDLNSKCFLVRTADVNDPIAAEQHA